MNNARAIFKIIMFALWTAFLVPLQFCLQVVQTGCGVRVRQQSGVVRLWYWGVLAILGVKVLRHGTLGNPDGCHVLYLSNHSSYLDVMVLGAYLPPFFVAKADAAGWPVFGFLAKIGGTLFIKRERAVVRQQMALFQQAMEQGRYLLLFPEGTTSDGRHILPFKSSLLHVLYDATLNDTVIMPVCVTYQSVNGQPFRDVNKDHVAWYGGMELVPHVWQLFQQKSITARLDRLPPIAARDFADAKKLTRHCEEMISQAFFARLSTDPHNGAKWVPTDTTGCDGHGHAG